MNCDRATFASYDWKLIASGLGASLIRSDDRTALLYFPPHAPDGCATGASWVGNRFVEISENGGEVNVNEVVHAPACASVPYWSNAHPGGAIGSITMAARLAMAMRGEPINYEEDHDA